MSNTVETRDNKLSFGDWLWEKYGIRLQLTINSERTVSYESIKGFIDAYERYKDEEFDGFTVEDEQKYYVLDSEDIPLLQKTNNHTCKTTTGLSIYEDGRDNSRFEFTEQEIKDYDERYFAFAVPVEATELF